MERLSLKILIDAWHTDCSEIRLSQAGTPMPIIPNSRMMESLKILAKTLRDNGYSYEEIDSPSVSMLIVDKCWKEDRIKRMSTTEIRKAKKNLSEDWDSVIHSKEFSGAIISKLTEEEKIVVAKKEESKPQTIALDLGTPDRIVMDTSDLIETPLDPEILAELAAIGTVLEDK